MASSRHDGTSGATTRGRTGPGAWLRQMYARFGHLAHEVGKFGVVGAVAYVVDSSLFYLSETALHLPWPPAAVISTTAAATVAFVGNRFWTWRDRRRAGLGREYTLFFLFNVVGLGIALATLWVSHELLGHFWPALRTPYADTVSKQIVGTALGTLFRFWSYRRFVFPPPRPVPESGVPAGPDLGWPTGPDQEWSTGPIPVGSGQDGGRPLDGQPLDGHTFDGRTLDGQPLDGRTLDGQPPDGRTLDGQPPDARPAGQTLDGRPLDGHGGRRTSDGRSVVLDETP